MIDFIDDLTKEDILDYAEKHGNEYAYNMLLVIGVDNFLGSEKEFYQLLEELKNN